MDVVPLMEIELLKLDSEQLLLLEVLHDKSSSTLISLSRALDASVISSLVSLMSEEEDFSFGSKNKS